MTGYLSESVWETGEAALVFDDGDTLNEVGDGDRISANGEVHWCG